MRMWGRAGICHRDIRNPPVTIALLTLLRRHSGQPAVEHSQDQHSPRKCHNWPNYGPPCGRGRRYHQGQSRQCRASQAKAQKRSLAHAPRRSPIRFAPSHPFIGKRQIANSYVNNRAINRGHTCHDATQAKPIHTLQNKQGNRHQREVVVNFHYPPNAMFRLYIRKNPSSAKHAEGKETALPRSRCFEQRFDRSFEIAHRSLPYRGITPSNTEGCARQETVENGHRKNFRDQVRT